jgi:hypothetical protein
LFPVARIAHHAGPALVAYEFERRRARPAGENELAAPLSNRTRFRLAQFRQGQWKGAQLLQNPRIAMRWIPERGERHLNLVYYVVAQGVEERGGGGIASEAPNASLFISPEETNDR